MSYAQCGCAEQKAVSSRLTADLRGVTPGAFSVLESRAHIHIPFLESAVSKGVLTDTGKGLLTLQLTLQGFRMLDFYVQPCTVLTYSSDSFLFS